MSDLCNISLIYKLKKVEINIQNQKSKIKRRKKEKGGAILPFSFFIYAHT